MQIYSSLNKKTKCMPYSRSTSIVLCTVVTMFPYFSVLSLGNKGQHSIGLPNYLLYFIQAAISTFGKLLLLFLMFLSAIIHFQLDFLSSVSNWNPGTEEIKSRGHKYKLFANKYSRDTALPSELLVFGNCCHMDHKSVRNSSMCGPYAPSSLVPIQHYYG